MPAGRPRAEGPRRPPTPRPADRRPGRPPRSAVGVDLDDSVGGSSVPPTPSGEMTRDRTTNGGAEGSRPMAGSRSRSSPDHRAARPPRRAGRNRDDPLRPRHDRRVDEVRRGNRLRTRPSDVINVTVLSHAARVDGARDRRACRGTVGASRRSSPRGSPPGRPVLREVRHGLDPRHPTDGVAAISFIALSVARTNPATAPSCVSVASRR